MTPAHNCSKLCPHSSLYPIRQYYILGGSMAQSDPTQLKLDVQQMPKGMLDDTLDEVTSWLARLVLLYGVPLHYLIPEELMLPEDSLRFFFLDPIWMQCL